METLAPSDLDKDSPAAHDQGSMTPQAATQPPSSNPAGGRRRGPVKITVNLLARAMDRLEEICGWSGESKTDAINRAIQLYALYYEAVRNGEKLRIVSADGTQQREIHIL